MKKDNTQFIELIKNQKSNFPLDQSFYTDPNIYRNDLDWNKLIVKHNNLDIFLSGTIPPNPTELLS